jgi:hypothetical protein
MSTFEVAAARYNLPAGIIADFHYAGGEDVEISAYFGNPFVQANIFAGRMALALGLVDDYAIITQEASILDVELVKSYNNPVTKDRSE